MELSIFAKIDILWKVIYPPFLKGDSQCIGAHLSEIISRFNKVKTTKLLVTSDLMFCMDSFNIIENYTKSAEYVIWLHVTDIINLKPELGNKISPKKLFFTIIWNPVGATDEFKQNLSIESRSHMRCQILTELLLIAGGCEGYSRPSLDISFPFCVDQSLDNITPKSIQWFLNDPSAGLSFEVLKHGNTYDQIKTSKMFSKLRKVFYNTNGWDVIIPKAKQIESIYTFYEFVYSGFPKFWPHFNSSPLYVNEPAPGFNFIDKGSKPLDANGVTPAIFCGGDPCHTHLNQEVLVESAKCGKTILVDMGHVLTGIDALNNSQPYVPVFAGFGLPIHKASSNASFATYVGDIGSVLAEYWFLYSIKSVTNKKHTYPSGTEMNQAASKLASGADMIGNIDAYVIKANFNTSTLIGEMPIQIFSDYYLSNSSKSLRDNRFLEFSKAIGLSWDGSKFSNISDILPTFVDDVESFAINYVLAAALNASYGDVLEAYIQVVPLIKFNRDLTEEIVVAFLRDLEQQCK
jgi:hypothetical protein